MGLFFLSYGAITFVNYGYGALFEKNYEHSQFVSWYNFSVKKSLTKSITNDN